MCPHSVPECTGACPHGYTSLSGSTSCDIVTIPPLNTTVVPACQLPPNGTMLPIATLDLCVTCGSADAVPDGCVFMYTVVVDGVEWPAASTPNVSASNSITLPPPRDDEFAGDNFALLSIGPLSHQDVVTVC